MSSLLIHAWTLHKVEGSYYLPYTHWVYLNEIVKYYDNITLLSPIAEKESFNANLVLIEFSGIDVIEMPFSDSYKSAVKYFFHYYRAYRRISYYDAIYIRYPVPFGWLSKLFGKKAGKRIVHYVGDPVDAAINNPNFSWINKAVLITFFFPEHLLYLWASKGAKVFTNGFHLLKKLNRWNIEGEALISSTLNLMDFNFDSNKCIKKESPKILYVGYLRKAKGIETVIKAFTLLQGIYPGSSLTIVGKGESESLLKNYISKKGIENVTFLGHIDNRVELNNVFRSHDVFCFASLSEGSPRVILEAMANGINVISTPVGSLPYIFEDKENILFANFNDERDFFSKIVSICRNESTAFKLRENAYKLVSQFTIEKFLKKIFNEN